MLTRLRWGSSRYGTLALTRSFRRTDSHTPLRRSRRALWGPSRIDPIGSQPVLRCIHCATPCRPRPPSSPCSIPPRSASSYSHPEPPATKNPSSSASSISRRRWISWKRTGVRRSKARRSSQRPRTSISTASSSVCSGRCAPGGPSKRSTCCTPTSWYPECAKQRPACSRASQLHSSTWHATPEQRPCAINAAPSSLPADRFRPTRPISWLAS